MTSNTGTRPPLGMVLAAGLGTRLRPYTEILPKPAVPLGHRCLASYAVALLADAGIDEILVNTHYLPDAMAHALRRDSPHGVSLAFCHEPTLLGTGGGVKNAWRGDRPLLIVNGDILFSPDLRHFIQRSGALLGTYEELRAVMMLRSMPDASRYGAVDINADGEVCRLLGRPEAPDPTVAHMFTGVHFLAPAAWADLPGEGCIVRESYRRWVDARVPGGARGPVFGLVDESPFWDLGTKEAYLAAHRALLRSEITTKCEAFVPGGGHGIHPDAVIGPGATVEGSVVGAHAEVASGVRVVDSVIWPGAVVSEDCVGAIVTP